MHTREVKKVSWETLRNAANVDLGDRFEFEVARPVTAPDEDQPGG